MIREGEERAKQESRWRTQSPSRLSAVAVTLEISGIKLREIGKKWRRIDFGDELMSEILFSESTNPQLIHSKEVMQNSARRMRIVDVLR